MERIVYHILKSAKPRSADFQSDRDRGLKPRGPQIQDISLWTGWSAFDKREEAEKRARKYGLGSHLAVLRMPADWTGDRTKMRQTLGRHHFTIWGTFEDVKPFIDEVVPVRRK